MLNRNQNRRKPKWIGWPVFLLISAALNAQAVPGNSNLDFAQVEEIRFEHRGDNLWNAHVTLRHADDGWHHYADAWQLLNHETGSVLGERILAHPHVNEQPFTRSLTSVLLPSNVPEVRVRARCQVHGFGGREIIIRLPDGPIEPGLVLVYP